MPEYIEAIIRSENNNSENIESLKSLIEKNSEFEIRKIDYISPLSSTAVAEKDYKTLNEIRIPLPDLRMMIVELLKDGFTEMPLADLLMMIRTLVRTGT